MRTVALAALLLVGVADPALAQVVTGRSGAPAAVGVLARGPALAPGGITLELRSSLASGKAHYRQGVRASIGLARGWDLSLGVSHHHAGTSGDGAGVFWGEFGIRSALWSGWNLSLLWHLDARFGNVSSRTGFGTLPTWERQQIWGTIQGGLELAGVVDDSLEFSLAVAFGSHPYVRHRVGSGTWCSGGSCEAFESLPIGQVRSGIVGGIGFGGALRMGDTMSLGIDSWLSVPLWAEKYSFFLHRGLALSVSLSLKFDLAFEDEAG